MVKHEVTSKLEKSFKKIMTSRWQKTQGDRIKELKKENKRLKKYIEEIEAIYGKLFLRSLLWCANTNH
jgi:predicted RNase H-like nuclease (RuvC/YqgF family)